MYLFKKFPWKIGEFSIVLTWKMASQEKHYKEAQEICYS